jgi:putative transposon-encoded protein
MSKRGRIILELDGSEIIEKNVKNFGTGAHIILPKKYANKKVKIIVEEKNE